MQALQILISLYLQDGLTVNEIAMGLHAETKSVSRALGGLRADGLVNDLEGVRRNPRLLTLTPAAVDRIEEFLADRT